MPPCSNCSARTLHIHCTLSAILGRVRHNVRWYISCQIDVHLPTRLAGGSQDPGTQTTWNSLVKVPSEVLHLSTGIPAATWAEYKKLPLVIAPGTGGEACLKRCGLNFTQVRSHSTF